MLVQTPSGGTDSRARIQSGTESRDSWYPSEGYRQPCWYRHLLVVQTANLVRKSWYPSEGYRQPCWYRHLLVVQTASLVRKSWYPSEVVQTAVLVQTPSGGTDSRSHTQELVSRQGYRQPCWYRHLLVVQTADLVRKSWYPVKGTDSRAGTGHRPELVVGRVQTAELVPRKGTDSRAGA